MANNNVATIASNLVGLQVNNQAVADMADMNMVRLPGDIAPYELPDVDIEQNFDPISTFAILESGKYGPLDAENLQHFLKNISDRRRKWTKDVFLRYTNNIVGLKDQLLRFQNRINEIKHCEKMLNDSIANRITHIVKALIDGKDPIAYTQPLLFTNPVVAALREVGVEGPLNEDNLAAFLNTGKFENPGVTRRQIFSQMTSLYFSIIQKLEVANHGSKFTYDKISKSLQDIIYEMAIL